MGAYAQQLASQGQMVIHSDEETVMSHTDVNSQDEEWYWDDKTFHSPSVLPSPSTVPDQAWADHEAKTQEWIDQGAPAALFR